MTRSGYDGLGDNELGVIEAKIKMSQNHPKKYRVSSFSNLDPKASDIYIYILFQLVSSSDCQVKTNKICRNLTSICETFFSGLGRTFLFFFDVYCYSKTIRSTTLKRLLHQDEVKAKKCRLK